MKKLLLLLGFIYVGATAQITAPIELHSAISSIHERGLTQGVDIYSVLENTKLQGYTVILKEVLIVDTLPISVIGMVDWNTKWNYAYNWYYNPTIYLSSKLLEDPYLMEVVLAHELGHIMGLAHSCNACSEIMSALQITNSTTLEYQYIYHTDYVNFRWSAYYDKIKVKYFNN